MAEIGCPGASRRQAARIAVASVRMLSEMHILLTTGQFRIDRGELDQAARHFAEVEDLLKRGIACGALVDPWNVLGFQGQFPRSPAVEDSVRDFRIDELTRVVDRLFGLAAEHDVGAGEADAEARVGRALDEEPAALGAVGE